MFEVGILEHLAVRLETCWPYNVVPVSSGEPAKMHRLAGRALWWGEYNCQPLGHKDH